MNQCTQFRVASSRSVDAAPGAVKADALELVEPGQALGLGVVIAIADGPDRGEGAGIGEPLGVPNGDVVTARIRVVDQPVEPSAMGVALPLAGPQRHLQGVEG